MFQAILNSFQVFFSTTIFFQKINYSDGWGVPAHGKFHENNLIFFVFLPLIIFAYSIQATGTAVSTNCPVSLLTISEFFFLDGTLKHVA